MKPLRPECPAFECFNTLAVSFSISVSVGLVSSCTPRSVTLEHFLHSHLSWLSIKIAMFSCTTSHWCNAKFLALTNIVMILVDMGNRQKTQIFQFYQSNPTLFCFVSKETVFYDSLWISLSISTSAYSADQRCLRRAYLLCKLLVKQNLTNKTCYGVVFLLICPCDACGPIVSECATGLCIVSSGTLLTA